MLEASRKEKHQDRFGRTHCHTVFVLICDICGARFERRGSASRLLSRKTHACSNDCKSNAHKPGGVVEQLRAETCKKKYGAENTFASEDCKKKIRETMVKNHGVEHALQSKLLMEKAVATTIERFGVDNASKSPIIKQKQRDTMVKNHGVEHPMQMKSVQEALEKGCIEKYGVKRVMQNQSVFQDLMQKHLGVTHPQKCPSVQAKTRQTCLDRYGVENVSKSEYFANLDYENKNFKTGYANFRGRNIWFRSSYERLFIKRLDSDATVIDVRCNVPAKYEFDGKEHTYFIDFGVEFVDGRRVLFEVKSEYMKSSPKNAAKFAAVGSQLGVLGYDSFEVVTEKELNPVERIE